MTEEHDTINKGHARDREWWQVVGAYYQILRDSVGNTSSEVSIFGMYSCHIEH